MADPTAFADDVAADARIASARTGVPVSVIIAQWGIETGWGTSTLWRQSHNYAGIGGPGGFRSYPDRAAGLADWIKVISGRLYDKVRAHPGDPTAAAVALAESPWDAGHYKGGGAGNTLLTTIASFGLTRYDSGQPPTPTNPAAPATPGGSSGSGGSGGGFSLNPFDHVPSAGDIGGAVAGALASAFARPLMLYAFVTAGLGLVVLGGWKAVSPTVKSVRQKVESRATEVAGMVAKAATV